MVLAFAGFAPVVYDFCADLERRQLCGVGRHGLYCEKDGSSSARVFFFSGQYLLKEFWNNIAY